jgi:hypothetical protein
MLDIGLFSIWGGLLLFEQHPLRTLSGQVKGVVFFLLWVSLWFLISLLFPTLFENFRPHEQHAIAIELSINISIAISAYLLAWIFVAIAHRKSTPFKSARRLLWFSDLIAWKIVIFNPLYSQETPQTELIAVSFILACLFAFAQTLSASK